MRRWRGGLAARGARSNAQCGNAAMSPFRVQDSVSVAVIALDCDSNPLGVKRKMRRQDSNFRHPLD
jgi:hypothetical protein